MTSEFRIIEFEHSELGSALAAHSTAQGNRMLCDAPNELLIDVDNTSVTAKWQKAARQTGLTVRYEAADVRQALIRFCKAKGIPLPVKSAKTICVMNGRITLLVEQSRQSTSPLVPLQYLPSKVDA